MANEYEVENKEQVAEIALENEAPAVENEVEVNGNEIVMNGENGASLTITDEEIDLDFNIDEVEFNTLSFIGSEFDYDEMLLNEELQKQMDAEQKLFIEQDIANNKKRKDLEFIRRSNQEDYKHIQELKRKSKVVRKDFKKGDDLLEAAKDAGFKMKQSILPFSNSFTASNAAGQKAIVYSGGRATFHPDHYFDPAAIKVACLAVKNSGLKKPYIFADSKLNKEQKEKYYAMVYEGLLEAGYKHEQIHFDNKAYEALTRNKFLGYNATSGIGNYNPEHVTDGLTEGKGVKSKNSVEKTAFEKSIYDDAYALFKSADLVTNKIEQQMSLLKIFQESKAKNAIQDINDISNNVDLKTDKKLMQTLRVNGDIKKSVADLKVEMLEFQKKYKDHPEAENYKDVLKTIELLDKTAMNPYSKNRKDNMLFFMDVNQFINNPIKSLMIGNRARSVLKDVSVALNGLKTELQEQNNFDFATLKANSTKDLDRRNDVLTKFRLSLESGNAELASNRSEILRSNDLNNLANNNLGAKVFPNDATVYKFNMSGEGVDLYFFQGKNGMEVVAGSGNKLSKSKRVDIDLPTVVNLMKQAEKNVYVDKPKNEASFAPSEQSPEMAVEKPKEADPVFDMVEPENTAVNAPQAAEPVKKEPVVEKFTLNSGSKSFEMEFVDGVGVHAGVTYLLKKQVGNIDDKVKEVLEERPHALAVKVLDIPPMDAYNLLDAKTVYETRNKPTVVDDFYVIPGMNGNLAYYIGKQDKTVEQLAEGIKGAAQAANVDVKTINGVFATDVHSFNLAEIKMNNKETKYPEAYFALKEVQKPPKPEVVKEAPVVDLPAPKQEKTDLSNFEDNDLFDDITDELLDDEIEHKRRNKFKI